MYHVVFTTLLLLANLCLSQVNEPFTGFTLVGPTWNSPHEHSTLFIGYQPSSDRIWLVGGSTELVMSYNIGAQNWTDHGTFSTSLTIGTVNAQSYAQWGDNSLVFVNSGRLRQFDFNTIALTSTNKQLPYNREAPCVAAIYNDWIFATGGIVVSTDIETKNQESDLFQIWNNNAVSWSQGPTMKSGRTKHACAIHNNYLYVFGGSYYTSYNAYDRTTSERIYLGNLPNLGSWSDDIDYIPDSNVYFQKAVVDNLYNQIYLIGGRDWCCSGGTASRGVQIYDVATNTMELDNGVGRLNTGRSSPSVILINNRIYVFGGSNDAGSGSYATWEYSNILTFAPTGVTISPTPAPTLNPTLSPTPSPTPAPTKNPTPSPTKYPTPAPTNQPTKYPTKFPTKYPSNSPSKYPTEFPSKSPSKYPTKYPTNTPTYPTNIPTNMPTIEPTINPTLEPTLSPTSSPTKSPEPGLAVVQPTKSPGVNGGITTQINMETIETDIINGNDNANNKYNSDDSFMSLLANYSIIIIIIFIILCTCCMLILFFIAYKLKRSRLKAAGGKGTESNRQIEGIEMTTETSNENHIQKSLQRVASTSQPITDSPIMYNSNNSTPPQMIQSTPYGNVNDLLDDTDSIYNSKNMVEMQKVMSFSANSNVNNNIGNDHDDDAIYGGNNNIEHVTPNVIDIGSITPNPNIMNHMNEINANNMDNDNEYSNGSNEGDTDSNGSDDGNEDLYSSNLKLKGITTQGQ